MARRAAAEPKEEKPSIAHPREQYDLLGHHSAEQHVLGLYNAGRLPHALLLAGARGIGKATFAYRLARFLLTPPEVGGGLFGDALAPESLRVGPEKDTFKRVAAASHADLLVLEADDIKVDDTRKVAAFLSMTPAESDWRVVIIDSADAMNRNAANALLKTLEEPPPRSLLILVSHNPGALLPTIRSRCRMLRMMPLHEKDFTSIIDRVAPDMSPGEHHALALLSGGSVGVSLWLDAQSATELYRDMLDVMTNPETSAQHQFADRLNRKEADEKFQCFTYLMPWLITRIAAHNAEPQPEIFPGEREYIDRLQHAKPRDAWLDLWERAGTLLADTTHLYLDKKQAVITLIRECSV